MRKIITLFLTVNFIIISLISVNAEIKGHYEYHTGIVGNYDTGGLSLERKILNTDHIYVVGFILTNNSGHSFDSVLLKSTNSSGSLSSTCSDSSVKVSGLNVTNLINGASVQFTYVNTNSSIQLNIDSASYTTQTSTKVFVPDYDEYYYSCDTKSLYLYDNDLDGVIDDFKIKAVDDTFTSSSYLLKEDDTGNFYFDLMCDYSDRQLHSFIDIDKDDKIIKMLPRTNIIYYTPPAVLPAPEPVVSDNEIIVSYNGIISGNFTIVSGNSIKDSDIQDFKEIFTFITFVLALIFGFMFSKQLFKGWL